MSQPPGAAMPGPVPEPGQSQGSAAVSAPAPQRPSAVPSPAGLSAPAAPSQQLLGRQTASTTGRVAAATPEADAATSPIARRRAAARSAEQALAEQEAELRSQLQLPVTEEVRRRVIEPPVEIRQRRFAGVHPGQIIAAEVALVGGVAALRAPLAVSVPVAIGSLALLALAFVRVRGRWAFEWVGSGLRFLARNRSTTFDRDAPGTSVMTAVSHGGQIRRVEVDGTFIALIADSTGFRAVIEVSEDPDRAGAKPVTMPPLSDLLPQNDVGDVPISVQIVTNIVPAPSVTTLDDAAANSYRELSGGLIPARRRTWVSVQAFHTPDIVSAATMQQAVMNAVRRVNRLLRKAGFRARVRNVRESTMDLLTLLRAEGSALDGQASMKESWGHWAVGDVRHVAYRVDDWPALAGRPTPASLIDGLERIPAVALTSSIAGRRVDEDVDIEAVVRFTMTSDRGVESIDSAVENAVRGTGVGLQRLNGDQRFGVGATLPMGGFAV